MIKEIISFDRPTRCIVHYLQHEGKGQMPYFQVLIDGGLSPSGEFIRFNHPDSEIHGWTRVEDIVIDEVLEHLEEERAVG